MRKLALGLFLLLGFQTVSFAGGDPMSYRAIFSGRQNVITAGTAQAVSTDTTIGCKTIQISALRSNTAEVYIGGPNVLATSGGARGVAMFSRDTVFFPINTLSNTFIDARVSGEGVTYDCYQ